MARWLQGRTASQKPHETPKRRARRRVEARPPQNTGSTAETHGGERLTGRDH